MGTAGNGFFRRYVVVALATAASGLLPGVAQASWKEMAGRLPSQTNAIVAINIDAVMRSPLAVQERWTETWESAYQTGPVAIIPGTQRVLAGAFVKPGLQDSDWHITMMEMSKPAVIEDVARSQGGYTEKIMASMAVCAPGAYYLTLDEKTLASFAPANRQSVYNWLCDKMGKGIDSPHLRSLATSMGASTHILMALDLQEQYSPSAIRNAIAMNPLSKLDPEETDLDKLAEVLAGIQYVVLKVNITDKLQATAIVQMATGAEWFAKVAKPLTTEILDRAGIALPEIENWTVKADGKRVTMTGDMTKGSLFDLLAILNMKTATKSVEASDDPAVIAQASRSFYRTICASLDSYPKASTYEHVNRWVQREAQKLEYLPLTNVDPDLVAWSVAISQKMREVSLMLAGDKKSASAAMLGVQNPEVVGSYGGNYGSYSNGTYGNGYYGSGYGGGASDRAAAAKENRLRQENAARQRMQILQQQQAVSLKAIGDIMGDLGTSRNAIRAKMVEKYKIEF